MRVDPPGLPLYHANRPPTGRAASLRHAFFKQRKGRRKVDPAQTVFTWTVAALLLLAAFTVLRRVRNI